MIGIFGMTPHDDPFIISERSGFLQDSIRHAHFTYVVEQRAAANVDDLFFCASQCPCQFGVISVTRWVCPSVSRSRRSSASTQPSMVLS